MQKALLISLLALAASPSLATESGHCDSKPFTLKKPATAPPAASKSTATVPKTEVAEAKLAPAPAPPPKPRPKIAIGCKQPAAK